MGEGPGAYAALMSSRSQVTSDLHGFTASMIIKTTKGVATVLLLLAGGLSSGNGQIYTNLHFFGGEPDGALPAFGLVQGTDGDFYGTTEYGGLGGFCLGLGTIYRVSPAGVTMILHSLNGNHSEGSFPQAGLVEGGDGNFYGTTWQDGPKGGGTIFRIDSTGNFTNLYAFGGSDGAQPEGTLVRATDGNFYGVTVGGGTSTNCSEGCGTVFRISQSGNFSNLYSFGGIGRVAYGGLVQGCDGNLYGTTTFGGTTTNLGTVFRISLSGDWTNLYSFSGYPNDGANPYGGLLCASDGNIYGLTDMGGSSNAGTIFRISSSGSITYLYSFSGADGSNPIGGLVQGSDGNLYGTTRSGGQSGNGTIFRISPAGSLTTLYSPNWTNGAIPVAKLVQDTDGNFLGTTAYGGIKGGPDCGGGNGFGTIFKLIVSLTPPANEISVVQVNGNDLYFSIPSVAGETYQLQFTTNLTSGIWSNVPNVSITNSIGALLTLTNFGGTVGPQGFYRFDITP